jgi:hypothetical protein
MKGGVMRGYLSLLQLGLITIAKIVFAAAVSIGTVILGMALPHYFDGIAPTRPTLPPYDSAVIIVEADVKDWEPIFPDGRIDATKPDRRINVANDLVIIGPHNWIVRFKVAKVVDGAFDSDEVHMLIHSPSQFGINRKGQRFVLCLRRRSERPRVIASSSRRLAERLSYFTFADPLYELVSGLGPPATPVIE